jgi:hypothetical protein
MMEVLDIALLNQKVKGARNVNVTPPKRVAEKAL